ncbi:hypothetical protein TgHK011_007877 [Trichoderma gracile]|nr:hypothetical protein TgHK011_007877 [Trichoderma gracile]
MSNLLPPPPLGIIIIINIITILYRKPPQSIPTTTSSSSSNKWICHSNPSAISSLFPLPPTAPHRVGPPDLVPQRRRERAAPEAPTPQRAAPAHVQPAPGTAHCVR